MMGVYSASPGLANQNYSGVIGLAPNPGPITNLDLFVNYLVSQDLAVSATFGMSYFREDIGTMSSIFVGGFDPTYIYSED